MNEHKRLGVVPLEEPDGGPLPASNSFTAPRLIETPRARGPSEPPSPSGCPPECR